MKLGPHILRSCGLAADWLPNTKIAKFVGDWALAELLPNAEMSPDDAIAIGRSVSEYDAQYQREQGVSATHSAGLFVWDQTRTYESNPRIDFWEGHNEPVWDDREGMAWYAQFEIERMRTMEDVGLKCVIGNFASGTPQLYLWPHFLPACEYALEHGHLLGLHEYNAGFMWWMTGQYQINPDENCLTSDGQLAGWTILRYRQVYDQFLRPAGLGDLPLVITECGLDPLVSPSPDGWRSGAFRQLGDWWRKGPQKWGQDLPTDFVPFGGWNYKDRDRFYAEQLWWYDQHLRQDDFVLGATVFSVGNWGGNWKKFDLDGTRVYEHLARMSS
jgi:hypothetical protein